MFSITVIRKTQTKSTMNITDLTRMAKIKNKTKII